jgi:23S rRNA 5-hydroxycytidine C2501 synthase
MRTIELLAPAKNKECGIEAILHGADAVYIGAPKFGARAAAGNSIEDIAQLIEFAHVYHAKVYVALNTLIKDNELNEVAELIHALYALQADAIIIQDMGILQLDIPPISLHASTQTDNRTLAKVKFLEDVGFEQIVLARELSLQQIKHIAQHTSSKIEVFVHGSLCVSYSGQCYISEALHGRSANRGECAQLCRLPYDLVDADKKIIVKDKHLLSLKDLNLSDHIEELIEAGVSSFKIEGRLKDSTYVKNITAYYRQKIDAIIANNTNLKRSSSGKSNYTFEPKPEKTFQRSTTSYFLHKPTESIFSILTPKSMGEYIGVVSNVEKDCIVLDTHTPIANGDGLCFISKQQMLEGFRVNKAIGNRIFPAEMPTIKKGNTVFRNADYAFTKLVSSNSAERKIGISVSLQETNNGYFIQFCDEDMHIVSIEISVENQLAQKEQIQNIEQQLTKLGNTPFSCNQLSLIFTDNKFIPSSVLSQTKRILSNELLVKRKTNYKRTEKIRTESNALFPIKELAYTGNVANELARTFYLKHGVTHIDMAFEIDKSHPNPILMQCKACIKDSIGYCPKKNASQFPYKEPLYLQYKQQQFLLSFDCSTCEMTIAQEKK